MHYINFNIFYDRCQQKSGERGSNQPEKRTRAVGEDAHYHSRGDHACEYGGDQPFEPDIQQRADQRTRPRARSGQGEGDEQIQTEGLDFFDPARLLTGTGLDIRDYSVKFEAF